MLAAACSGSRQEERKDATAPAAPADAPKPVGDAIADAPGAAHDAPAGADWLANVEAVEVSGEAGAYRFSVTLRSPDTGCAAYANWWEVARPDGTLVYRRILTHSHVDEQPFTRSGGQIAAAASDELIVRAHFHHDGGQGGYGGVAWRGSAGAGFGPDPSVDASFAPALAQAEPLPSGCAF